VRLQIRIIKETMVIEEVVDRQQIRNLLQARLNKVGLKITGISWEKNWNVHWVGISIDSEPISRRETDSILQELEKELWQWDKVKYQFYLKFTRGDRGSCIAYRNGEYLSPKQWDKQFKLYKHLIVNKGVWRKEYRG